MDGIREIFSDIHAVMKLAPEADEASSVKTVHEAMDVFLAKWLNLGEVAVHDSFKKEWASRIGARSSALATVHAIDLFTALRTGVAHESSSTRAALHCRAASVACAERCELAPWCWCFCFKEIPGWCGLSAGSSTLLCCKRAVR